jgi:hypothetical protein
MSFENIPAELRALRQWVVWRSIVRDGRITKPPFNAFNPNKAADVRDPGTWATFDEAVECLRNNASLIGGIGFVFTEQDEYVGIDIDDETKVTPENLALRREVVKQILEGMNTYTEVSPSGSGIHIICKGKPKSAGRRSSQVQIELYAADRYFTMTGNAMPGRLQITNQQDFIDAFEGRADASVTRATEGLRDNEERRADLSDEEVLRRCTNQNSNFAPRYQAQVDCEPGKWSDTFLFLVGMIERHSGSLEQIKRLVMNSPMVQIAPPSSSGESRIHKATRDFPRVLARVRPNNNAFVAAVEHGRKVFEGLEQAKLERARKESEALRAAEEAIGQLSSNAAALPSAFPFIEKRHLNLTRPSGIMGEFVKATEAASYKPFTKFAIPAAFASLAGIMGRGFKLGSGMGLNMNFILAAPSNAGKTSVMKAWERFINDAGAQIQNTIAARARVRILNSSASSIQSLMEDFQASPSIVWFVEECFSQLETMSNGRSPIEAQFRDAYNQLYDASEHGHTFTGPRSMTLKRANVEPINNLCVSTFWTTTASKLDVFADDALDGFLSRVVMVRHNDIAGEPVRNVSALPSNLQDLLIQRLAAANLLDETYTRSVTDAARMITFVATGAIDDLMWDCILACDKVANAAIKGKLPPAYGAISRLPMLAGRMSGLMAALENPFSPSIAPEQYQWAFGYLLQNLMGLMSAMDTGELGESATDEVTAVVKAVKEYLRENGGKGKTVIGVPKSELRETLKHRSPFGNSSNRSARVTETFVHMLKEGMISEVEDAGAQGRVGRPRVLICPNSSDAVWKK